jgi:hypothetical protein
MATITGIILFLSAEANAMPRASPSKKLWMAEPNMFMYPAEPFPLRFSKQFLLFCAWVYAGLLIPCAFVS